QVVFTQKVQACRRVGIVLMFGRFLGFWFDVELALKSNRFLMIDGHVQEGAEMVEFSLQIGIPQSAVPFPTAPEHVTFSVEFVSDFDGLFNLGCGISKYVGVTTGRGAVHESGMNKQTSGAPQ